MPGLYAPHHAAALFAMAAHMAAGAVILVPGPVQLLGAVRRRWPALHRWVGQLYVLTAAVAGAGGLRFLVRQRTIGGAPMDAGFGLYGALVLLSAVEAYRRGRAWMARPAVEVEGVVALNLATAVVLVGSCYFLRFYRGPASVNGMLRRGQKDRAQGSENVIVANSASPRQSALLRGGDGA
ncbi:MAG TPA: DUF2306 domain-containing protein [Acidobacteriaceae bacterium]|nr:DUF2306 domain-containing protein [Acidobacteriaceae bacterium]